MVEGTGDRGRTTSNSSVSGSSDEADDSPDDPDAWRLAE